MLKKMSRNYNIDRLKALCAVLVIIIHANMYGYWYIEPIARCAVPCFFIISGFFIYIPDNISDTQWGDKLKRNMKRILYITLWSTVLFAVVDYIFAFSPPPSDYNTSLERFAKVILNENPFGAHLWYLSAYLYVLAIVYCLWRYKRISWIKTLPPPCINCIGIGQI